MPDISIIVPIYNTKEYLDDCLKSIIRQTTDDIEVILVDDGSTDGSGELCEEYAQLNTQIKVIHKENGGLSDARNAGMKTARGEYVLFVDGDDMIEPDSLAGITGAIRAHHPDVLFLRCRKAYSNGENEPMGDGVSAAVNSLHGDKAYSYLSQLPKFPASACTKAYRREFIQTNGFEFEKGRLCEDLDWSLRVYLEADAFAYFDGPYYIYRQRRGGSITSCGSERKTEDILRFIEQWYERGKTDKYSNAAREMIFSFCAFEIPIVLSQYSTIPEGKRSEWYRRIDRCKEMLLYNRTKRGNLTRLCYNILGGRMSALIMSLYLHLRG